MSRTAASFGQVEGADAGPGIATIVGPCRWVPPHADGIWGALVVVARPWLRCFMSAHAEMENAAATVDELNLSLTCLEDEGRVP